MRAVVNVSVGERFKANHDRLEAVLGQQGENLLSWRELPGWVPSHEKTPFAFKAYILEAAHIAGVQTLLWADSSIVSIRPLAPLWELIERQGYWFSVNLPHGTHGPAWMTGQWTCDEALAAFDPISEDLFKIPHVIGTAFGLDMRHEIAQDFLDQYLHYARDGKAFRGPWTNEKRQASKDPRVFGHRHDQTVASVIAWRLGMKLTTPPAWIVDGLPPTEETVLQICR